MKTALLAITLVFAAAIAGQNRTPLPDQLTVTDVTGASVDLVQRNAGTRWLAVYVGVHDHTSDSLLSRIGRNSSLQASAQVAIICDCGNARDLQQLASRYPTIDQKLWYADSRKQDFRALKLTTIPAMLGIEQGKVAWTFGGTAGTSENTESIMASWVAPPVAQQP
jgi:hypothetical protein